MKDLIIQLCRKWGVPYIDVFRNDKLPVTIFGRDASLGMSDEAKTLKNNAFIQDDNYHPNAKAQQYNSHYIEQFLRNI